MNYLGKPVFPLTPNWAGAVTRQITYDLRETLLGFGAEFFTPSANYTVNAFIFEVQLASPADITSFEYFCDQLTGRLKGFWLPNPQSAAQFAAGISTTQFKTVWEDLATSWNTREDQYLLFTFIDGTQAAAQISGVVNNGDGTETVTLTAALPQAPAAGTIIQRLHFVRWAGDEEQLEFDAEGVGSLKLTAIELPLEYLAASIGIQPLYLYDIHAAAPVNLHWRYTSFAAGVVSGGKLFNPWPMNHSAISGSADGQDSPVDVDAQPDPSHPFSLLAGVPPGQVIWIDIYTCDLSAPDTTVKIFSGYLKTVTDDGVKYTAHCETRLAWLKTKLPRFYIGTPCNHFLYEPNTCKVVRGLWETTVTYYQLVAGRLPVILVTFNFPFNLANWQTDGWFAGGLCEAGVGTQYEIRSVIGSHWNGAQLQLTLNAPFKNAGVGGQLQLVAGCDHTAATCKAKFNNFQNFGGFPAVPDRNLSLKGLNTNVSAGNKKS